MPEEGELRRDCGDAGAPLSAPQERGGAEQPARPDVRRDAFKAARGDRIDLFVYGTLMNDRHVELLLNRKVESVPAVLHNYMRVVPPGAFYFVVRQHAAVAHGRILKRLTKEEIALIDSFEDEGRLYFRRVVVARSVPGGQRQRCMTYVGNIPELERSFGKEILFEDRYSMYLERKIDQILEKIEPDRHEITRRALRELLGAQLDNIIESHFDGNYICNYIMIQALNDAKPPVLASVLANEELKPYADNYLKLACKHIVFNQLVELVRHQFPDAVRVSKKYFRHGLSILLAFLYYNRRRERIEAILHEKALDRAVEGRLYRDYAALCIGLVEEVYRKEEMRELIDYVDENWYSTPTPIGAELEFSHLGARAVNSMPGEDKAFDGFYWFDDFDLQRRTWRLGGHVDSHRSITPGQTRHRGFFEYALGRFNIMGDLSRPLFDCPWAMSLVINEAVKFLEIPPHSLHISLELSGRQHSNISDAPHRNSDLACLLLLGGDLRPDEEGRLREWRIYNNELDTNQRRSLNFSDRKRHYCKPGQEESEGSEVMEYKFARLRRPGFDYSKMIVALKGYQCLTHARAVTIPKEGEKELPEQLFLRSWAERPEPLTSLELSSFVGTVERGLMEEFSARRLDKRRRDALANIYSELKERNDYVAKFRN